MIKLLIRYVWYLSGFIPNIWNHIIVSPLKKAMTKKCGKKVLIGRKAKANWENITIGDCVSVGPGADFTCTKAEIFIGNHVMFGPNVTMITGGHRTDVIGKYMDAIGNDEKSPENDRNIILKGDNWIGANAVILKGVTIGQGSVIAAGAVVTKNVIPYSIVGGVPAKTIKMRFDENSLEKHIKLLNSIKS